MNGEFDLESQKSPETIEREIDAQRASIGNIVDALESKFTPGQMFDQALGMMQNNGTAFLGNLGTSVRNNPVPAVLTSVGLLWLIMSQNRPPVPRPGYRVGPDQSTLGEWTDGMAEGIDSARERVHQTADSLKEGFHSVKDKAASVSDTLSAATDSISHTVHDAGDRLMRSSQAMGAQFGQLLKEQPLMVAAAGIALGAMLGAALPSTAAEQRYMGKTSASLTDKVKQQAREGFETVRDTVTRTTDHSDVEEGKSAEQPATATAPADLSRGLGTT
jgi:ElaB/YqjD/DUF883 family membrane-anchored ribosome-binding protein